MKKKVIILWHNGGRLANQLWLFISAYAYALEKGYRLENHSFFEYSRYFNMDPGNPIINLLYFKSFIFFKRFIKDPYNIFFRRFYKLYVKFIENVYRSKVVCIAEEDPRIRYLPPTDGSDERINKFDSSDEKKIYLDGWLFRNPVGIIKHGERIREYFRPKKEIEIRVQEFLRSLKVRYQTVVGVHIRQGDYKTWQGGKYYFTQEEVSEFLRQYLSAFGKQAPQTCFVVCSDGKIDMGIFKGLNVVKSHYGAVEDLFILASTNIIIGSCSTFGAFASYYGDIPFITFRREGVDWDYYLDKKIYFDNKYYPINTQANI